MSDLFDFEQRPQLFAVMGNPIAHSKSPQIHQMFAAQFDLTIDYQKILVEPGGFEQAVENFRASGGRGLNITVPLKMQAWYLCEQLTARARLAEAVNTLWFDGGIHGDNTDGIGLLRDITGNLACPLAGRRTLLLGAGGATRGVLGPLLQAGPSELVVANRTVDKALQLAGKFSELGRISGCGLDDVPGAFDVVINATAASLQGEVPQLTAQVFADHALAYDLVYSDQPTPFMIWAAQAGAARQSDGLGMLVEQAAESFAIWHGETPQTAPVIAALR